jgi:hypothetical protein
MGDQENGFIAMQPWNDDMFKFLCTHHLLSVPKKKHPY